MNSIQWRPTLEQEALSLSDLPNHWPILYSFSLSPAFYNSLPFEICSWLMRVGHGNSLYFGAHHPVDLSLTQEEFTMFNEMLFTQIGHA